MSMCTSLCTSLFLPNKWASKILPLTIAQAPGKTQSQQVRAVKKEAESCRSIRTQSKTMCSTGMDLNNGARIQSAAHKHLLFGPPVV